MTHSAVRFQVDPASAPSLPSWMEEVAVVAHILTQTGIISALEEHVRFARARFGTYDTIDFMIVLLSYARSFEPTLKAFYDRLAPFRDEVAVLFQRHRLPSRSALSRFLAELDEPTVEALRTQFLHDRVSASSAFFQPRWIVGSLRSAVRSDGCGWNPTSGEPSCSSSPPDAARTASSFGGRLVAPGYTGRKRGEGVRTRTTILQVHTHQWLGTFGEPGNGDLRGELQRARPS